jgi:hypothetical protein
MSVGLPGTGVGGLFYLVSALCMPFREAYRAATGRSDARSRDLVMRQTLIALGVLGGIWLAGWLIGMVLSQAPAVVSAINASPDVVGRSPNILKVASLVIAFATLITVVGTVEVVGLVRRWRAPRALRPSAQSGRPIARPAA